MTGSEGVAVTCGQANPDIIAACREAIKASDETAKAATGPSAEDDYLREWFAWPGRGDKSYVVAGDYVTEGKPDLYIEATGEDPHAALAHIAANDPATRLALNAALTVVLDGIEGMLALHGPAEFQPSNVEPWCRRCCDDWTCPEAGDATASLAAVAQALGAQP